MASNGQRSNHAPRYAIPSKSIVTVEHPFVVKNVDKAIDMLGGHAELSESLRSNKSLPLSFNPSSPGSRTIMSTRNSADNVLLRFTVPKRMGKRKRGSDEPFAPVQASAPVMVDAAYLLRSIKDNKDRTTLEAVGNIQKSHVWRSLPDFDYSTRSSQFLTDIHSKIIPQEYTALQQWQLPRTFGLQNTDMPPPPTFTTLSLPQVFDYRPSDHEVVESSKLNPDETPLKANASKNVIIRCDNLEPYPSSLPADYPKLQRQTAIVRRTVPLIQKMFNERPIWTKRALSNRIDGGNLTADGTRAIGYVAFSIASGPWSNTLCAFGIDPRADPRYRKFQTIRTAARKSQKAGREGASAEASPEPDDSSETLKNSQSHVFTGQGPLSSDGHTFQLCDLEDPQLRSLVDVDETHLSNKCDSNEFGWYGNGTLAKIRLILRSKISALETGKPLPDSLFDRILRFPEHLSSATSEANQKGGVEAGFIPESASFREKALAAAYRKGCYNGSRLTLNMGALDVEDFESDEME